MKGTSQFLTELFQKENILMILVLQMHYHNIAVHITSASGVFISLSVLGTLP